MSLLPGTNISLIGNDFMEHNQFNGLATNYNKFRPAYPEQQFQRVKDIMQNNCVDPNGVTLVLDVGSGTGISTRMLRRAFDKNIPIVGIEPGIDMLQHTVNFHDVSENLCYIRGTASSICFNDKTADLITTAQAIQWFDRPVFYIEAARVLKEGGVLAIVQNNRSWEESPFLDKYEILLETYASDYSRDYRSFDIEAELSQVKYFSLVSRYIEPWSRYMSGDEFIGMANSSTKYKSAVVHQGAENMDDKLNMLIQEFLNNENLLEIKYKSELYIAVRNQMR